MRRLLVAIPSLLIASLIVFSLPRLIPGDVVQLMLEEKAYGKDLEDLRAKLGLNRPMYIQYVEWLGQVTRGDLGESLWTKRPVLEELARRLPISLELGVLALFFAIVIAVPIGVLAAIRQDTLADFLMRSMAILGLSVPGFWIATLCVLLPAIGWGWSPTIQFTAFSVDPWAHFAQFLLPAQNTKKNFCVTQIFARIHTRDCNKMQTRIAQFLLEDKTYFSFYLLIYFFHARHKMPFLILG